ncbi:MAG: VirB4 family type IV secretion system protein [Candidatus Dormibacteria bacterium]
MNRSIRVPLAVDAQVRLRAGPFLFPLRAVILCALMSPLVWLIINVGALPDTWRMAGGLFMLMMAASISIPCREGVWLGTWVLYRSAGRIMPSLIIAGEPRRAHVRAVGATVQVARPRAVFTSSMPLLSRLNHVTGIPETSTVAPGIIRLVPGGARAIMRLAGPAVSLSSDAYLSWCRQVMSWALSTECPVQFLTVMNHFDGERAQAAFDRRTSGWPRTALLEMERALATDVAQHTLGLRHYVVLSPLLADPDGVPHLSRFTRLTSARDATEADADRALRSAMRVAAGLGIEVSLPDRDDIAALLSHTVLGAKDAMVGGDVLRTGDQHSVVMTMTQLPATIESGVVVEAMMRVHTRGLASLHVMPVHQAAAQRILHRRTAMLEYAARRGADAVETGVALRDTTGVVAAIAQRDLVPCRMALTLSVSHPERVAAHEAAERLTGILTGCGLTLTPVSSPGFLPALALCPGAAPLGRSLQLTSDGVALRMLPALGTPFDDVTAPLLGINALTGAPAYFSIWAPPNHNMVVVGSSGSGKSVAAKTLLTRHLMEGMSAVVIDPDSEYQQVMNAIGGEYFELGEDALNPLAAGTRLPPDTAASLVLPILSVMGGDEKGLRDGRPIRRLPDEDQGWLHAEVACFYQSWPASRAEPVMHDLIDFLDTESRARALTPREVERCSIITARLRRYTQGRRARVFDRHSSFAVGTRPVAIGLRVFAMSYGADLTPALAVVLTSILAAIERRAGRMIVVVDEAHRVTSDPDAGEVLGQLVRQARKYGAGVWMCSQRVEDFVRTDLGRTLSATASTKLILGTEEAVIEEVAQVFKLRSEEASAINPMAQGRGVFLSGAERTIVNVLPGPAILALSDTSPSLRGRAGRRQHPAGPTPRA